MNPKIYTLLLLLIFACKKERPFEYSEGVYKLTNGDLKTWLEKSPFDGKWNYQDNNKATMVVTNIEQVFPFLGKFKNESDDFKPFSYPNSDVYQKETLIFKDTSFGESFVHATLTYEPKELFLTKFYSETGNVILSGVDAIYDSHSASLVETMVSEKNDDYKTALYWVSSNYKTYIFGFYQKENLVFEVAFPCKKDEKSKAIQKIKEINSSLNLSTNEWATITESKLEINDTPESFWKDPYFGLYRKNFLHQLSLKIKNTPLLLLTTKYSKEKNADYVFAHETDTIALKLDKTTLNQIEFEEKSEIPNFLVIDDLNKRKVFIEEEIKNGQLITNATLYFKDNSILKITASSLTNNTKAKEQLLDILQNIRIRNY